MAVTPRHGQSVNFWLDSTADTLINLSSGLNEVSLSRSMDASEVTTFTDGGNKTYIPGLKGATISCSGIFSSTHAEKLDGIFGSTTSTTQSFEFSPDGTTAAGRHLLKGECVMTSLEYGASVADAVSASFELLITGAVTSTNH